MALNEEKLQAFADLKSQNWYKLFFANYGRGETFGYARASYLKFLEDNPIRTWITRSMEWSGTPQGYSYWYNIHLEWQCKYRRG